MRLSIFLALGTLLSSGMAADPQNPDNMKPCLVCTLWNCDEMTFNHFQFEYCYWLLPSKKRCNEAAASTADCGSFINTNCTCPSDIFTGALMGCLELLCDEDDWKRMTLFMFQFANISLSPTDWIYRLTGATHQAMRRAIHRWQSVAAIPIWACCNFLSLLATKNRCRLKSSFNQSIQPHPQGCVRRSKQDHVIVKRGLRSAFWSRLFGLRH